MFARLGLWFDSFFTGYAAAVASAFAAALTPVALALVTAYICLYGYSLMRGEASEPLGEFSWKMIRIAGILGVALSSANYMTIVLTTATDLQDGMASVFLGSGDTAASSSTSAFALLDGMDKKSAELATKIWKEAGIWRLDMFLAGIVFSLGTAIFLLISAFVTVYAKVLLTFALAIGPLAILCLIFKQSTRFFESWISFMLSAIVLAWLTFFALGMSFWVGQKMLEAVRAGGAFDAVGAVNGVEAAFQYLVVMVLLCLMLWQAPSLASALTSGPAMGGGGRMIANMLGVGGRGGGGGGGSSGGGGSVSKGSSSYAAGKAMGSAYQRVAQRGRGG